MGIQDIKNLVISPGELIVVSGVNGLIASHVANEALAAGFKVRGTTRDAEKNAWIQERFDKDYGQGMFELVEVKDMVVDGAFDEVVKGASGFIHVASNTTLSTDVNKVMKETTEGVVIALKSAATSPSIKRFVYTSSSSAAVTPKANQKLDVTVDSWNYEALEEVKKPDPQGWDVYYASKTKSEQEAWKWIKENKPNFVFNAVLPNANFGRPINHSKQGYASTSSIVESLFNGDVQATASIPPQHFVNVRDDGILHVIALVHPDVANERVFAFAHPYSNNRILAVLRKLYPDRKFADDLPDGGEDLTNIVARPRAEALLREAGRPGWIGLEETVRDNTIDIAGA